MASTPQTVQTHTSPSRYNFMVLIMTTLIGIVSIGYIGAIIAYLVPRKGEGARAQSLGSVGADSITGPDGTSYSFQNGVAGPFIYDATGRGDAQGIYAVRESATSKGVDLILGQTCTHLGCPVGWTPATSTFNCPCHGSIYSKTGQNIGGPAPAPLFKYNFSAKGGQVTVQGRQS